jgi:excinuclease UvrABC nuclease subunit
MKMCLAPCFAGCTPEDYDTEVGRVVTFLSTRGGSLTAELEREREAASEALDFERAAAVHRRIEKAAEALRGLPDLARRMEDLNAVVLQRAAEENTIAVFVVRAGRIEEPRLLRFAELAGEPRSVEQILREWLEGTAEVSSLPSRQAASHQQSQRELEDHLSLLTRWFHKKPRAGEIFFREATARASTAATQDEASARRNSEWPYRRILRACSRLLAPPAEEARAES